MDKATSCQTILAEPEGIIAYQRNKPLYDSVKELLRTDSAIAARGNTFSAKKDARARWNDSYTVKHLYDGVQRSTMDPAITAPSHPLSTGETQGSRALGEVNKTSDDVRWENSISCRQRIRAYYELVDDDMPIKSVRKPIREANQCIVPELMLDARQNGLSRQYSMHKPAVPQMESIDSMLATAAMRGGR